ncbi:MAG: hypothetical protein STSR0008_20050 [Ignavibacterium sp.]
MFRIIPDGNSYNEYILLKNGEGILFKSADQNDIPLVTSFLKRISPESLRMRFMASVSAVPQKIIEELCIVDFTKNGSLLAISNENGERKIVGIGNYIDTGNGRSAEVSLLVEDSKQGKGIGTALLERLAGLAAANGFYEFEGEVLPDNLPMLNVFKNSGFNIHRLWSSDTVHIELPVDTPAALWERTALREHISVANSLVPLLKPKSVAVIGASRKETSIGNIVLKNIVDGNFKGTIYPINPNADFIYGIKVYHSLKELPGKIDLAIISLHSDLVINEVKNAIQIGAKGIVILSAGFADSGIEGKKRERELVEIVRKNGVRLLGPNCLGIINTDPNISLNASLASRKIPQGQAGFFSHSAALGIVIIDYAIERGISFTSFVSAGNRADVSGNDLLLYWEEDPNTKMAILYLETFGNPRRFVRIARNMSYKKPILCVKAARSSAGRKTIESKIGSIIANDYEVEALFQQTGIIVTPSLENLFDVAIVLSTQPLPKGNRVNIIANSAGIATLFADACEMNNFILNNHSIFDLGAFTSEDNYEIAVRNSLVNENVDALFVGFACIGNCTIDKVVDAINRGANYAENQTGIEKPILLCLMGATGTISAFNKLNDDISEIKKRKFPAFRFPELAVNALGKIIQYVEFKKQPLGKLIWYENVQSIKARNFIKNILYNEKNKNEEINLDKNSIKNLLTCFGIQISNVNYNDDLLIQIQIRTDPLFGPLIKIIKSKSQLINANELAIIRITPLTERDLNEIIQIMKLENYSGTIEVIGKLSQMIEEIPWLWSFETKIILSEKPNVISDFSMIIKSSGVERPSY